MLSIDRILLPPLSRQDVWCGSNVKAKATMDSSEGWSDYQNRWQWQESQRQRQAKHYSIKPIRRTSDHSLL